MGRGASAFPFGSHLVSLRSGPCRPAAFGCCAVPDLPFVFFPVSPPPPPSAGDGMEEFGFEDLVGMRGPISRLFENAATVLLSNAVFMAVAAFIPLLAGRLAINVLAPHWQLLKLAADTATQMSPAAAAFVALAADTKAAASAAAALASGAAAASRAIAAANATAASANASALVSAFANASSTATSALLANASAGNATVSAIANASATAVAVVSSTAAAAAAASEGTSAGRLAALAIDLETQLAPPPLSDLLVLGVGA